MFTIERHSMLKTVVTPFWKKCGLGLSGRECGPGEFGSAGWGCRAGSDTLYAAAAGFNLSYFYSCFLFLERRLTSIWTSARANTSAV